MGSTNLELVSNAYTLVTLENNTKVILKINQGFLDMDLIRLKLSFNHIK